MVLIGDGDLIRNDFLKINNQIKPVLLSFESADYGTSDFFPRYGNSIFFQNLVDELLDKSELIPLRSKMNMPRLLKKEIYNEKQFWQIINIIIPLLLIIILELPINILEKINMLIKIIRNILFIFFINLLFDRCDNSIQDSDFKNFAVKDTANISKFRISDTEGNEIVISRENSSKIWMINGTNFKANQPSVDLLMETFYRIRVKQDVSISALNTVINRLSVRHKKSRNFH